MAPFDGSSPSATANALASAVRPRARAVWFVVLVVSLLGNLYLIGLLRHSPGSYGQLKAGGTAAYPGTVVASSDRSISVKTASNGTKRIVVSNDTPYALFPKDYQTLIPIGLPATRDDIVVKSTEASVSAQLPYLAAPKALRINLVRSDVLTGKVIELSDDTVKFKGFAATGAKEETRTLAAGVTYQKLGADGTLGAASAGDAKPDMGLYAYLTGAATDASSQITKLILAEFTSTQQ